MSFKDQLLKLKDNWLLIALVVVILGVFMFWGSGATSVMRYGGGGYAESDMIASASMEKSYYGGDYYPVATENFAPEVQDRLITKTASLTSEVKRGTFFESEAKLKAIVTSSDSYMLNENVNKYDYGSRTYYSGSYQIKIESSKYSSVMMQLKEIGEITYFNENSEDITGSYVDLQTELEAEKARLERYKQMYDEATEMSDKITLSDSIFNEERTIKYLEEQLANMDNRVSYSTVYVTINEKQSEYVNVIFVKFAELVRNIVNSINSMLNLLFIVLPWAAALAVILVLIRIFRKKKRR